MPYFIPNYSPLSSLGSTRRRIWRNENDNPVDHAPFATMHEEDVGLGLIDGTQREVPVRTHSVALIHCPVRPEEVVELRHVITDELIQLTTLGVVHTMIYSLGRHMQSLRDAAEAARYARDGLGNYSAPNYAPLTVLGTTRRRIWRNENNNPLGASPYAIMYEECVGLFLLDGELVERSVSRQFPQLIHYPTNPDEVVILRRSVDDVEIGLTTLGSIHTMIYSLGRHLQGIRDTREIARVAELEALSEVPVTP